ncbi:MAG: lipoyl(octanoyl) transferase LipB [Anaerolineales bacterium]|nr:lipoyl(octanoyl) transferase LipB [Anaerolineales bacterium]MCW5855628.1 lipoyl(octanoyl) transferase LipB [Anaerolineales bacterium]
MTTCQVFRLGVTEYQKAWHLQNQLAAQIAAGEQPPTLLLLEHSHVYTFGTRGQAENLLWEQAKLQAQQVDVHWVDRGGDVTYHGPGQLVGYPLLPLGEVRVDPETGKTRIAQGDYVGYLRKLEYMLIASLAHLGVPAGQVAGQTGVWVQPDVASRCRHCPPELKQAPSKIASIGVKVDARGISRHGFALNVAPQMSYWDGIIACGLENQNQISLDYLLDPAPGMDRVIDQIVETFGASFGYEMQLAEGVLQI